MAYLLAALGGALGALARWGVATALPHDPGGWPWATLVVNLTGCLLIGVLLAVLLSRFPASNVGAPVPRRRRPRRLHDVLHVRGRGRPARARPGRG